MEVNKAVNAYLALRDRIGTLNAEIKQLEEMQDTLAAALLVEARAQGVTSFSTTKGTVVKQTSQRFYSNDWPEFRRWVLANEATDLFESRLHQGNTKQWMDDHPDNVPPGLQADSKESIVVRRK